MSRRMTKIKFLIDSIGAIAFIIGLAGLAGAAEGQGSFLVSAIVFAIGFGISLWGYTR